MTARLQICALLAVLGLAGAAAADPLAPYPGAPGGYGPVKVMVIVSAHGLNLSSADGAHQFVRRLEVAVNRACDDRAAPPLAIARSQGFYTCRERAMEMAMAYVSSPLVKRAYAHLQQKSAVRLARR
jgi:UrcA family protein